MESFKQFIVENWQFISTVIIALLTIILAVLPKKKITQIHDDSITMDLVHHVQNAEALYGKGHGQEKMLYVLKCICREKGFDFKDSGLLAGIETIVEEILKTPERKEK